MTLNPETANQRYSIRLDGGLDDYNRKMRIKDVRWHELTNGTLQRTGSISSRGGSSEYDDKTAAITDGIRSLHRYKKRDGTSEILLWNTGDDIYGDDSDDGAFASKVSSVTSQDGYCRFVQWGDCAIYTTENKNMSSYNSGETWVGGSGIEDLTPVMQFHQGSSDDLFALVEETSFEGDVEAGVTHSYRFTASIYHGDTFLGETFPLCTNIDYKQGYADSQGSSGGGATPNDLDAQVSGTSPSPSNEYIFAQEDITTSTSTGDPTLIRIHFKKSASWSINGMPPGSKYINIYKKGIPEDRSAETPPDTYPKNKFDPDYWLIGSVDVANYYSDTAATNDPPGTAGPPATSAVNDGDTVFLDDGYIPLGKQISYQQYLPFNRARFVEKHKNRLWMAYTNDFVRSGGTSSELELNPDRIIFSDRRAPFQSPVINSLSVSDEGEGITGLKSFANRMLLVFTTQRVMAILGGDDEFLPGTPNFYTDIISENIGCIAPQSITWTDGGLVWLSERGLVIFNGQQISPLGDYYGPKQYLDDIPADRRYHAVGFYDRKNAVFCLAHTYDDGDTGAGSYNRYVTKYSFITNTFTREYYSKGIGAAVSVNDTDQDDYVLLGRDDSSLSNYSVVVKMDSGNTDPTASGGTEGIDITWESGFVDCGNQDVDKIFMGAVFQYRSPVAITVDIETKSMIDADSTEHGINTEDVGESSFTLPISQSASSEDDIYWLSFDERIWGKVIKIKMTATNTGVPIEMHSIDLFFRIDGKVRKN